MCLVVGDEGEGGLRVAVDRVDLASRWREKEAARSKLRE